MTLKGLLRLVMTSVLVPALLMTFVYFGFSTNYTRWVFGERSFSSQYEHGIYRYRVLGREGLLATYRLLKHTHLELPREKPVDFTRERMPWLDGAGDLDFYAAYFVWNTLGLMLAMVVLSLMLRDRRLFEVTEPEASLWVLLIGAALALTQFVVTPYDTWAAALLISGTWASWRALLEPSVAMIITSVVLLVLGTLNRETALLNVALVAAAGWTRFGLGRRAVLTAFIAGLPFLITYVVLRLIYGTQSAAFDSFHFDGALRDHFSRIGTLTLLTVLATPLLVPRAPLKLYARFLLFASPYLVVTLGAGVTWEVRLWVPLLIAAVVLSLSVWEEGVQRR